MLINPFERYYYEKGIELGKKEGMEESQIFIARNMLNAGFEIDLILKLTGLSKNKLNKL